MTIPMRFFSAVPVAAARINLAQMLGFKPGVHLGTSSPAYSQKKFSLAMSKMVGSAAMGSFNATQDHTMNVAKAAAATAKHVCLIATAEQTTFFTALTKYLSQSELRRDHRSVSEACESFLQTAIDEHGDEILHLDPSRALQQALRRYLLPEQYLRKEDFANKSEQELLFKLLGKQQPDIYTCKKFTAADFAKRAKLVTDDLLAPGYENNLFAMYQALLLPKAVSRCLEMTLGANAASYMPAGSVSLAQAQHKISVFAA